MNSIEDYNSIMSDHNLFNNFVYTPLSEALRLLEERQKDPVLLAKIEELLNGDIPELLRNKKSGVQFRQIATPNYDACHFVSISRDNDLIPVFFEYLDDKFTSNNEYKHSLGQLRVQSCVNKNDNYAIEKITIIDFNKFNGKKLKEVNTLWGESLIDFHRKLFNISNYSMNDINFYDASLWFKNNGGKAVDYYANFFLLFMTNGILFENFLLNDEDSEFTREVVLPALEKVINLTGVKPLIVPIGPIDMETDNHWISYDSKIKKIIPIY
jgi:hypothetical protein